MSNHNNNYGNNRNNNFSHNNYGGNNQNWQGAPFQYPTNYNMPKPKRSGAKYTIISKGNKKGLEIVNAFRFENNQLIKAVASPIGEYNDKGEFMGCTIHKGAKMGNEFMRYKVVVTQGMMTSTYYCLMRLDTKKIVIQELGMVISPKGSGMTRKGKVVTGYFGRNFRQ